MSGNIMRRWLRHIGFIVIGLAIGIGLGLYLGWVAWPTEFTDAAPSIMQESYQRDYVVMIAAAYSRDGDLETARRRLRGLGDDGEEFLLAVTLDQILRGDDETRIRQLVRLASDVGLSSPAMAPYLPESGAGDG